MQNRNQGASIIGVVSDLGPLPPSCDHANRNATSPASVRRVICVKRPLRPQVSIVHFRAETERALITVSS